jgi:hypothetical protein
MTFIKRSCENNHRVRLFMSFYTGKLLLFCFLVKNLDIC